MKKNEKGFSLVVVLFAIVIFSTIGLSLFTLNFNNTKQINITKEQLVATDLAEMGIIYYETLFTEHSYNILNKAIENARTKIESINQGKKPGESKIPINSETLLSYLNKEIMLNENVKIGVNMLDNPKENFRITSHENLGYNSTDNTFTVIFNSEGFTGTDKRVQLTGNITLDLKDYIDDYLIGNLTPINVTLKEIPKIDAIEQIKNIQNECVPNNFNSLNNCKINAAVKTDNNSTHTGRTGVIEGKFELGNKNTVKDAVLYIKNNIVFNQSFDVTNSIIYSEGKGVFGNSGLNNTTLYVKNGGDFGNVDVGIIESKVYSDGDFKFGNLNNSHIENSDFIINGKLETGNLNTPIINSHFSINGDIHFDNLNKGFNDSSVISTGKLSIKNFNDDIKNSILNIQGNIDMGHFNKSLINTQIFSQGNFTMDNLNSNISNSKIVVMGNFKSGNFNNSIDETTIICASSFTGGIVQYKTNNPSKKIFDSKSNPELFKEGGICSLNVQSGVKKEIDPTSLLNNLNVKYN